MAEVGSQRDADDSVDRLITEAASLYGYANLKDEQKKVLKWFVITQRRAIIAFRLHKSLYAKLPDPLSGIPLAIGGVAREISLAGGDLSPIIGMKKNLKYHSTCSYIG